MDWGAWIKENRKLVVFDTHAVCHHYSFFNQQDWMDRTSLLEELRETNGCGKVGAVARAWARAGRLAKQLPNIVRRRLSLGK